MPTCAYCRKEVTVEDKVFRRDACPHCGRDLHSCRNCMFFERGRQNDCREERAENVLDKDSANFCDYFRFGSELEASVRDGDAKAKLAALFKNSGGN